MGCCQGGPYSLGTPGERAGVRGSCSQPETGVRHSEDPLTLALSPGVPRERGLSVVLAERSRQAIQRLALAFDHVEVQPALLHQLFVRAGLDDLGRPSITTIRSAWVIVLRRWAMTKVVRSLQQVGQRRLDELLALGVEVAGGLVEDEDLRVGEDRAGDAEALPLPAGELEAALADERVVALGELRR